MIPQPWTYTHISNIYLINSIIINVKSFQVLTVSIVLTSVTTDGVGQFHICVKLSHLLNDLTNLQSELICRCDAQALQK